MASPTIPAEYVCCVQAGKKHHDLFTTTYAGENFCGRCGLANPLLSQRRTTSRTPALPGPDDEAVELEDTPPRPISPASHLLRQKPVSFAGVGHAQLLPNSLISFSNGAKTRAQMSSPIRPPFEMVTSAANQAIRNPTASTRKPTRHRTGYQWVHISLLLVSLETRFFNGLVVEVPETVLPLKDTVIKFNSADLLTWPSFTETLFEHLRPLLGSIDPASKELWTLSYASAFSGKKIITVPNTDRYATPSSMLSSGHFSNNQSGQLKVFVILTSTQVIDKQEAVTPLRSDEYPTPAREKMKRKIKQEDESPVPRTKKRAKKQKRIKDGDETGADEIKQEIRVKTEQEDPFADSPSPRLTGDRWNSGQQDEVEQPLSDVAATSALATEDDAEEMEDVDEDENEDENHTTVATEFVRNHVRWN
ncbi:hypothetical protein ACQRIU_001310 [Beauveria bassiana]